VLRFLQRRRKRDEHGVVAIVLALIACFVLIPVAALAVDIGVQRVARSDMQSLADVVAMDLARHLDGEKSAADLNAGGTTMQERAEASLDKNTATVGEKPTVVAELGTYDLVTDSFEALPEDSAETPNAVRVTAATAVDFGFMPGSGGTARSAIAQAHTSACFQLGSWAATLDPSASPLFGDVLGQLLGTSTLTAAGYNGLASARLSLLDLIQTGDIGAGTVNELLALENLTVGQVYRASAKVLRAQGKLAEAAVFDSAAGAAVAPITIKVGDLIDLTTANDAALQTQFNALDLLLGTAFLANGENLLNVANLQASLASVGVTNTQLRLIERAQRACNYSEAQTAQVRFNSVAKVSIPSNPVYNSGGSRLELIDNHIALGVNVDIAGARGRLTDISCNPDVFKGEIWTDLVSMDVNGVIHLEGNIKVDKSLLPSSVGSGLLGLLPSVLDVKVKFTAVVNTSASRPPSATATPVELSMPPNTYDDHVSVGSGSHALPHVTVGIDETSLETSVSILGLDLSPLTDAVLEPLVMPTLNLAAPVLTDRVAPLVNPLIDKVNGIVGELGNMLGLNIGGADFYGLPYPNCQTPVIRK
jgi:uncharacterized membrane protein